MATNPPAADSAGFETGLVRAQLLDRRRRLRGVAGGQEPPEVASLLREVDAALERIEGGTFGSCEVCHDLIERDRLAEDPLVRVCLDCMSADQRRFLEHDLQLAASIQTALLPPRQATGDGWEFYLEYRPLAVVSGDYCDLIRRDRDALFILGDVSGKGIAAAMLMANLQAAFRSLAALQLPLGEVMVRANRLFSAATPPSSYATLVCGHLHGDGMLEIGNAGHTPPLLGVGSDVLEIEATGVPLGLFPSARFGVNTYHLGSDDRLLLYTDGVSEAVNERGEEYGDSPLWKLMSRSRGLSAGEHARAALEEVDRFRGSAPAGDDLTVAALRRTAA